MIIPLATNRGYAIVCLSPAIETNGVTIIPHPCASDELITLPMTR